MSGVDIMDVLCVPVEKVLVRSSLIEGIELKLSAVEEAALI